jgi:excisionase family DNA binding protein
MVAPARSTRQTHRPFLSVADVCEALGIARSTFYDWRAKGAIPRTYKLPNGDLRIRVTDFETWLETLEAA